MNIKLTILTAAILVAISGAALAEAPTDVPARYVDGPLSPDVDTTNLSAAEKAAYSLYEGVLQTTEGVINATSCNEFTGTIKVFANGKTTNGTLNPAAINYAKITSSGGNFRLDATVSPVQALRGQKVKVDQTGSGLLDLIPVDIYTSTFVYNSANNILVANSAAWSVEGSNGDFDEYKGSVIKDFYRGNLSVKPTDKASPTYAADLSEYNTIYDWGVQSVTKVNYPLEKYWQRSKSRRSDGVVGRTVFVKDRLVGEDTCRIIIDTAGTNSASTFSQDGFVQVLQVAPKEPVAQFDLTWDKFNGNEGTPKP